MSVLTLRWISYRESEALPPELDRGGMGGWVNGHNFAQYLETLEIPLDDPHYRLLYSEIVARGLREGGDWHQCADDGVPLFSDGTYITFSYRAWGDLLAAIWNTEEKTNRYGYMNFYMSCLVD